MDKKEKDLNIYKNLLSLKENLNIINGKDGDVIKVIQKILKDNQFNFFIIKGAKSKEELDYFVNALDIAVAEIKSRNRIVDENENINLTDDWGNLDEWESIDEKDEDDQRN
ncbi:MAG: hypothetical protein AD073_000324 [Mycoplasmataceae bacterium]|nr:MAG: hypothetical protein AD073_000324 [Mycoplasmataceae bacterium]